jgi:alpha-1,6-mannosyltransferase
LAQVANYVGPTSGGLRVVVEELGRAHLHAGADRLLILPAPTNSCTRRGRDVQVTVASRPLPGSGRRYHVLLQRRAVVAALEAFGPDLVEVHDQTTLTWVSGWARRAGVPSILVSHERLDLVAGDVSGLPASWWDHPGQRWSARLAGTFDAVVCASDFAAEPFVSADAGNVRRVPFGVDLHTFRPQQDRTDERLCERAHPPVRAALRLAFAGRLWPDKAPDRAVDVLAELRASGVPAQLVMAGEGPMEGHLRRRARRERLPVHFIGHLADRADLSTLLAGSDVVVSPGRRETFGLGILEAMACGTPVVVSASGASRELLAPGAGYAADSAQEMALAVRRLVQDPASHAAARVSARDRAELFSWAATTGALSSLRTELRRSSNAPTRTGPPGSGGDTAHRPRPSCAPPR